MKALQTRQKEADELADRMLAEIGGHRLGGEIGVFVSTCFRLNGNMPRRLVAASSRPPAP